MIQLRTIGSATFTSDRPTGNFTNSSRIAEARPPSLLSAALTFAEVRAPWDAGRRACATRRTAGECGP
jgi:hypothetical protein